MPGARIGIELAGPLNEAFRLTDYLGRGAFGEVYQAVGIQSGRVVAVKLLPTGELEDPATGIALLNEVKLSTKIVHPNVVRTLHVDTGSSSEIGPYIVMELVSGGTLARLIRSQKAGNSSIPLRRGREMMLDIAQGARAINESLVHRDIKPDNILIDDKRLKISDFGISKVISEQTRTHTFKGGQHLWYMAPEGWENLPNTLKVDVYSVGLVYYEILLLRHPFEHAVNDQADWKAWRKAHLFSSCPNARDIRSEVSLSLAQLLLRMVQKRPQDRPAWDEVLRVLSFESEDDVRPRKSLSSRAVELAVERQREIQEAQLAEAEEKERQARKREIYEHSCQQLIASFQGIIADFNASYQSGKIEVVDGQDLNYTFLLPAGAKIECKFFPYKETTTVVEGCCVIGGGLLAVAHGASANLLLLRDGDDDLYGRWVGCRFRANPVFTDEESLYETRGFTRQTVQPFGFQILEWLCEEVKVTSGLHMFTKEHIRDLE